MTCPGTVHKTHGTICLLGWKQETMQRAFIAILTFALGTGKSKRNRRALRNSVLIHPRRDSPASRVFFVSTAPYAFSFGTSLSRGLRSTFSNSGGLHFLAGAAPRYVCTYYDVVEYLNVSSHSKLHAHILPKKNLKEPLEVKMDFMLVAILSVVRTQNPCRVLITENCYG